MHLGNIFALYSARLMLIKTSQLW